MFRVKKDSFENKDQYEYLIGNIGQEMFPIAKQFLCEHCRKDL